MWYRTDAEFGAFATILIATALKMTDVYAFLCRRTNHVCISKNDWVMPRSFMRQADPRGRLGRETCLPVAYRAINYG